ncbi:MAG: monovalent cation/H+ antiporter complex subunit F [Lachnospiraceae bacterium]|nr:monovalent cation/H+ antiporter complex subunit F [Lachnospiraceae bacterium]
MTGQGIAGTGGLAACYAGLLTGALLVLAVLIIISIIRSVLGPGISDRIIAVNMTGTMIIMMIAILSVFLDENYLVDVCLIYAMISFLGVVVLCKVYTGVFLQRKHMRANLEAIDDNLHHQDTDIVEVVEKEETEL